MKSPMKIASYLALAATIVPSVLFFTGTIGHDAVKWTALVGSVVWFIATPLWMGRELSVDVTEVTKLLFFCTLSGGMLCFPGVSQGQPRNLFSDTWVATDALGRTLPTYDEAGPTKSNKTIGMFYFLWQGAHGTALHDNTKIIQANPSNPQYGPRSSVSLVGRTRGGLLQGNRPVGYPPQCFDAGRRWRRFYLHRCDERVYLSVGIYSALAEEYLQIRAEGGKTPQIAFITHHSSAATVQKLYNDLYSQGLYSELWFQRDGKPLILGDLTAR